MEIIGDNREKKEIEWVISYKPTYKWIDPTYPTYLP